jgi:hypothetical protein
MAAPAHANHLALGSTIPTDAGGVRRTGDKGYKARSEGQLLCSGDDWGSSGGIILGVSILFCLWFFSLRPGGLNQPRSFRKDGVHICVVHFR